MSVRIALGGPRREAAERVVLRLVSERVASRITAQDPTLVPATGPLDWTEAVADSVPLVVEMQRLQHAFRHRPPARVVLTRADGAALAAAMMARTIGGELVVGLDDVSDAVVVADPADSGAVERAAAALRDAGADAARLVLLGSDGAVPAATPGATDVAVALPLLSGAYGALGAAALVPAALAGADLREVLDEAESEAGLLALDAPENTGLLLGAAIAAATAAGGITIEADGTHIVGFPVWGARLLAETPGLEGAVSTGAGDAERGDGLLSVRLVEDADDAEPGDDVLLSGTLGELVLLWEYAAAVAALLVADPGGPAA